MYLRRLLFLFSVLHDHCCYLTDSTWCWSECWRNKPAPDRCTVITMFDCWYDALCLKCSTSFTPDVTASKMFHLYQMSWRIIKMLFDGCEMSHCVLSLSVKAWTWTLTEAPETCRPLDNTISALVTSNMRHWCPLGVILVGQSLQERFSTVLCFTHVNNGFYLFWRLFLNDNFHTNQDFVFLL